MKMTTTTTTTTTVNIDELFAKAIKSLDGGVVKYESDVLTTSAGQKFKIIIHQLVWYAVKLFVEVDPRLAADDLFVRFDGLAHIEQITVSEHTALKGAEDKRDELLNDILSCVPPNFVKHLSEDDEVINHRFFLKVRHGKKVRKVEFIGVYTFITPIFMVLGSSRSGNLLLSRRSRSSGTRRRFGSSPTCWNLHRG